MDTCITTTYDIRSNNSTSIISPMLCILLVLGIIAGLVCMGSVMMTKVTDSVSSDTNIFVMVSGDDLHVTVIPRMMAEGVVISSVDIALDGISGANNRSVSFNSVVAETPIVCKNLIYGVTGGGFVVVTIHYSDGSTHHSYTRVQFS